MKKLLPSLVVLFTLLFALCSPGVAYAQDVVPEDPSAVTEETPLETPAATQEAPTETEGAPVESPEALADAPTQEAITTPVSTVQFCKVDDTSGVISDCVDFSSIMTAVAAAYTASFDANVGAMIKLLSSSYTEEVAILGASFTAAPSSLVLTGASTINGSVSIMNMVDTSSLKVTGGGGTLSINGSLLIEDVGGDVTLTNLSVTNPESIGIEVGGVEGNVVIDQVNSSGNDGPGLMVDTGAVGDAAPADAPAMYIEGGDVTITNSIFNDNGYSGAMIRAYGSVTVTDSQFDGNGETGLDIRTAGGYTDSAPDSPYFTLPLVQNVVVDNVLARYNRYIGIWIIANNGDVSVTDTSASRNGMAGLGILGGGVLDVNPEAPATTFPSGDYSVFVKNVDAVGNITGIPADTVADGFGLPAGLFVVGNWNKVGVYDSNFNDNYFGVFIEAVGEVSMRGVSANNEMVYGGQIQTAGPIYIACSQFKDSEQVGLLAISEESDVTLENVSIRGNGIQDLFTPANDPILVDSDICYSSGEEQQSIVIRVYTNEENGRSATANGYQGMVFKLVRKLEGDQEETIGRIAFPSAAVAGGVVANFKPLEMGSPAALESNMTFVGPAFNLSLTGSDGMAINKLNAYASLMFKLDEGFVLPEGQRLVIVHYDEEQAKWVELSTGVAGQYAYAFTTNAGAFALVTVPVE